MSVFISFWLLVAAIVLMSILVLKILNPLERHILSKGFSPLITELLLIGLFFIFVIAIAIFVLLIILIL